MILTEKLLKKNKIERFVLEYYALVMYARNNLYKKNVYEAKQCLFMYFRPYICRQDFEYKMHISIDKKIVCKIYNTYNHQKWPIVCVIDINN